MTATGIKSERRMVSTVLKIIAVNFLVFLGLVLGLEGTLQLVATIHPSYDVLFLQPDRGLGWKQVPNLEWTWAGSYWYAADFSVPVKTNSLGFRDLPRTIRALEGVKRVAVLGDSFIEAVQVPFESTATQQLERKLNAVTHHDSSPRSHWEVMNFGISNYGVGQYLLTWQQYAREYKPDVVAIFVAGLHMERTVQRYEQGAFSSATKMWIRPTFELRNGELLFSPARDFDEFVRTQQMLIAKQFDGLNSRPKRQWITLYFAQQVREELRRWLPRDANDGGAGKPPELDAGVLAVNLSIIKELGRSVTSAGATLIVLDVSQYLGDSPTISNALRRLCSENEFRYVAAYEDLMAANGRGTATRWKHDGHLNEAGNEILADSMLRAMTQ